MEGSREQICISKHENLPHPQKVREDYGPTSFEGVLQNRLNKDLPESPQKYETNS